MSLLAVSSAGQRRGWRLATLGLGLVTLLLIGHQVAGCYRRWQVRVQMRSLDELIVHHAQTHDLDPLLVRCVVAAESSGDPLAVSHKNARGLMQITPPAESDVLDRLDIPPGDLLEPDYNLMIGTAYLAHLRDRFDRDLPLILAAYHMGQTRVARLVRTNPGLDSLRLVEKHAGPQTRAYVVRILRDYALATRRPP